MKKKPIETKTQFLNLAKIEKIDFEKGKYGASKIQEQNYQLIESSQVDSKNLKLRFEV